MIASSVLAGRRRSRRGAWEMNLTPLVDVMFNLMIFILVTAQYTSVYSMKVDLPKAETAETLGEKEIVIISLTQGEEIYFGRDPIELTALETELKTLAAQEKPPQVILKADQKSTTGMLVSVMDLVQKAGLKRVSLQTEK